MAKHKNITNVFPCTLEIGSLSEPGVSCCLCELFVSSLPSTVVVLQACTRSWQAFPIGSRDLHLDCHDHCIRTLTELFLQCPGTVLLTIHTTLVSSMRENCISERHMPCKFHEVPKPHNFPELPGFCEFCEPSSPL